MMKIEYRWLRLGVSIHCDWVRIEFGMTLELHAVAPGGPPEGHRGQHVSILLDGKNHEYTKGVSIAEYSTAIALG